MVVPGLFGCDNVTSCGSRAEQEQRLLAKMDAYIAYLGNESRVVGLAPWHLATRTKSQNDKSPCDMHLGAVEFPTLLQKYSVFAASIKNAPSSSL